LGKIRGRAILQKQRNWITGESGEGIASGVAFGVHRRWTWPARARCEGKLPGR